MAHSFMILTAMLTSLGSCFMNAVKLSAMASCLHAVQVRHDFKTTSFSHASQGGAFHQSVDIANSGHLLPCALSISYTPSVLVTGMPEYNYWHDD
jgi:hypothetical protein